MKVTIVSGCVATGKTTYAKRLAKRTGAVYVDGSLIIKRYPVCVGYDRKRRCKIVDTDKLNRVLLRLIKASKKDLVIDSHLAHYLFPKAVDLCVITICSNLKELARRLRKRGYAKGKVEENLEAEIMEVCLQEAHERGHNVRVVDTARKV